MVLFHVNIAYNVVVDHSVLSGAEVPWLFLGVIRTVLKTFQLVIEVQNVVCLLVSESTILFKEKRLQLAPANFIYSFLPCSERESRPCSAVQSSRPAAHVRDR